MARFFVVDNPDFVETSAPADVAHPSPSGVDEDIETCFYHMTHDLRATLRAIKHLPEWIRDDLKSEGTPISEQADEYFDLLAIYANRADRLLLDLRTYSRVGRMSDNPSPQGLELLFHSAMRAAELPKSFAVETNFEVETLVAPSSDMLVLATALLHNAWYHHDQSNGTVFISTAKAGEFVEIVIGDDGPGIPEEHRQRVFRMLTTLRPRDEVEGSGLGLSIVLKIVTLLGGTVFVRDREAGRGTEVVVRLPNRAC
jgi:signal transduction histidine kinase